MQRGGNGDFEEVRGYQEVKLMFWESFCFLGKKSW